MTSFPSETASATGPKFGRDVLDSTPPHGRLRSAPKRSSSPRSPLKALAGGDSENSPDGEFNESDPTGETHDLDTHPVVQAFDHYGQAKGHLQIVGTLMGGEVLAPIQDLLTNLDQLIPQRGAAMLSGNAIGIGAASGAPGAGTSPLAALAGPPSAGPMDVAGGGVGAGAGGTTMTPPQMGPMGMGGPVM